jgi:hypothetical protein
METAGTPPVLFLRAAGYRLRGRVHFPKDAVGEVRPGADDDYTVVRVMTLDPTDEQPATPGAIVTIRFHFKRFSPAVNARLSLIPAPFIAAQPGFRSKTWMTGRTHGGFQGIYEWDTVAQAEAYQSSFPLRLMKRRAAPESVVYEVTSA